MRARKVGFILLKSIGRVVAHYFGVERTYEIAVEAIDEIKDEVWRDFHEQVEADARRAELEGLIRASHQVVLVEAREIAEEVAAEVAGGVDREGLAQYLTLVPALIRQTMRRPGDADGRTIRPGFALAKPDDLAPFIPRRGPRFAPGDRPVAGADWVLDELLGVGGFGEVWKAHNEHIAEDPPVALKFCIDPAARERLLKHEARLVGRVKGLRPVPAGIVALVGTHLNADPPCLVYEYVEGGDLTGLMAEWGEQPNAERAARVVLQVARAVAIGHRLEPPLVHRDLKPANILTRRENGRVSLKVGDYGIGGLATAQAARATRNGTARHDLVATAIRGAYTPHYASPEQMRGDPPDPRDDVHALGVIWYQLALADPTPGRPGGSAWKRKLVERRGLTAAMVDVIESCFEEADDRPADAAVLAERIQAILAPVPAAAAVQAAPTLIEPVTAPRVEVVPPVAKPRSDRWTNTLGMTMIRIEPDEFTMGSADGADDEKPPHRVRITRPFALAAHPVTQGQYLKLVGKNPSRFSWSDNLPVEQVSWHDAVVFCNRLSERDGLRPCYEIQRDRVSITKDGTGYRLPTEAEWEFACRAGTKTRYPFGDDDKALGKFAWFSGNSDGLTHDVGLKQPNAWGLHDMLGNVWEWCEDWYSADYYKESPREDPRGPATAPFRVIRGGSWGVTAGYCRPAFRDWNAPGSRLSYLGLRVASVQA